MFILMDSFQNENKTKIEQKINWKYRVSWQFYLRFYVLFLLILTFGWNIAILTKNGAIFKFWQNNYFLRNLSLFRDGSAISRPFSFFSYKFFKTNSIYREYFSLIDSMYQIKNILEVKLKSWKTHFFFDPIGLENFKISSK